MVEPLTIVTLKDNQYFDVLFVTRANILLIQLALVLTQNLSPTEPGRVLFVVFPVALDMA